MKLSVLERINLTEILPLESNFFTFKILTKLRTDLSLSEKEMKEIKLEQKQMGDKIRLFWDDEKAKEKDIVIGEQTLIIIKAALKRVDAEGKVNADNESLFDKFLPEIGLEITK